VKTKRRSSPRRLLAAENRGLLLDLVVFVLNLFLMQRLTRYALELFRYADEGEPLARFTLLLACIAMWALPALGAVLKRWHFHRRLQARGKTFDLDSKASGCLFNPLFYFCLNLVLVSAIIAGAGQFLFGNRLSQSAAIFVPSIFFGLIATIVQTYLIYRFFSPPKTPPRSEFLRQPQSEALGDVCIFLNMILFQIVWNFLAFADLGRPSGVAEFVGRLFFLCFIALLIYFPPRMFYLADDINRPRTWLTMLLANSPVIVRVLIGTKEWQ
jgi:Na+/H+ antiporter NhaD/arsenite permease-like protein